MTAPDAYVATADPLDGIPAADRARITREAQNAAATVIVDAVLDSGKTSEPDAVYDRAIAAGAAAYRAEHPPRAPGDGQAAAYGASQASVERDRAAGVGRYARPLTQLGGQPAASATDAPDVLALREHYRAAQTKDSVSEARTTLGDEINGAREYLAGRKDSMSERLRKAWFALKVEIDLAQSGASAADPSIEARARAAQSTYEQAMLDRTESGSVARALRWQAVVRAVDASNPVTVAWKALAKAMAMLNREERAAAAGRLITGTLMDARIAATAARDAVIALGIDPDA